MMQLVTDRTYTDVLMGNQKGCYGPEDLNRVEQAVAELAAIAQALDVQGEFVIKTDWALPSVFSPDSWPTATQMRRYLDNVHRLCSAVELAADLPTTMEKLTWEGANRIEQALEQTHTRIHNILQTFQFSGEIFAGEERYL